MSLLKNTIKPVPSKSFSEVRGEKIVNSFGIIDSLKETGSYDNLLPTKVELSYVEGVYNSSMFFDMDNVTEELVNNIAKEELVKLNNSLRDFTNKMGLVASESTGLFDIMGSLSKEASVDELDSIWEKAVNVKPTLMTKIIGYFNKDFPRKKEEDSKNMYTRLIESKSKSVDLAMEKKENELKDQRDIQEKNINLLNDSFDLYYHAVVDLRKKYILLNYIQTNFQSSLNNFKKINQGSKDINLVKKLSEYERVSLSLESKRQLMQKTLLGILHNVQNNNSLINSSRALMTDIDNTILHSIPSIRSNIVSIAVALRVEKGLRRSNEVKMLELQQSKLATKVTGEIAIKTAELRGVDSMNNANAMASLVKEAQEIKEKIRLAQEKCKINVDSSAQIMHNAMHDMQELNRIQ